MRISLKVGSTVYPIAGAAGVSERTHSSAADFQLTPQAEMQIAEFVRGEYAKPIDRGNLLNVLSFSTTRQFATVAEAQLWCLDYAEYFPSAGTLLFDAIAPDGFVERRHLADAVVDPPRRRIIGATALLDYTVQGGAVSVGGTRAGGSVNFSGVPTAGQTVTIAGVTYTWAAAAGAAYTVKIGASAEDCAFNLCMAIWAESAEAGVRFGAGTVAHPNVTANEPSTGTLSLLAKAPGLAGNSLGLTETSSNVTVTGFSGGVE